MGDLPGGALEAVEVARRRRAVEDDRQREEGRGVGGSSGRFSLGSQTLIS